MFPPDLIDWVVAQAARDPGDFVDAGLFRIPHVGPSLSADFVFDLGAAMKFLDWESDGIDLHLQAGLPPGSQAMREVFVRAARSMTDPSGPHYEAFLFQASWQIFFGS